jgi:D-arabinose 1-dehydrogenase-like Zn-dependent alcohol dehydrogenase
MKAMVVREAGKGFAPEERETREPGPGEVRVDVHACGVCHSDKYVVEALWPALQLPRVPGHEVAGVVGAVGAGVQRLKVGDRVGIGWHGFHDGTCAPCLRGHYLNCANHKITGISLDGGYAESMLAPEVACARVPDGMALTDAAPLLCAGVTTYNALRNSAARPGDVVGVQGLGGLGHLGVQFARAMGFVVVAVSHGAEKRDFAEELGAHHYVDTTSDDLAERFAALGGAKVILGTAPHAASLSALVHGLAYRGQLLLVGAPFEPLEIHARDLLARAASVQGWPSGTASDSTDTMAFAHQHGIRPRIETFPLEEAATAYAKMRDGSVRFRSVLAVRDA